MQTTLRQSIERERDNILTFWDREMTDHRFGGFYGKMAADGQPDPFALKGSILMSRILQSFSAGALQTGREEWLAAAGRAYAWFRDHCIDPEFGGVVWDTDYAGRCQNPRKEPHAMGLALYALATWQQVSPSPETLNIAKGIYSLLQLYTHDPVRGGYNGGCARNWEPENPDEKSVYNQLHILEGFIALYGVWPDDSLRHHLQDLTTLFLDKIIDPETGHLRLMFDNEWKPEGNKVSYGHDFQASWQLLRAAEALQDEALTARCREVAIRLTDAALEGMDTDGGVWYASDMETKQLVEEKRWWPQAEALVALVNAWQISGDEKYLARAGETWDFIGQHILDQQLGEWRWGVNRNLEPIDEEKAGFRKGPCHNSRACMEIVSRLQ